MEGGAKKVVVMEKEGIFGGGTCQPVALWGGRKAAKHIITNLL